MRHNRIHAILAFALLFAQAAPLAAQVEIIKIDWQLRAGPAVKFTDYLRALVTLRNPADKAAEGLVLRYALSMRLLRKGNTPDKAFWGIPFYVEEVRVSKINPSSERQARVIRFELQNQLNKLRNSGFEPTALKLEVMLNPRQGDEPAAILREAVMEIVKP